MHPLWCLLCPTGSFGPSVTIWGTNIDCLVPQTRQVFSSFSLNSTVLFFASLYSVIGVLE